jgi:hypothetical protein
VGQGGHDQARAGGGVRCAVEARVVVIAVLVIAVVVTLVVTAGRNGRGSAFALDLGVGRDRRGQAAAAGKPDRQHAAGEGLDRACGLVAVLGAVIVGVVVARVEAGLVLARARATRRSSDCVRNSTADVRLISI